LLSDLVDVLGNTSVLPNTQGVSSSTQHFQVLGRCVTKHTSQALINEAHELMHEQDYETLLHVQCSKGKERNF